MKRSMGNWRGRNLMSDCYTSPSFRVRRQQSIANACQKLMEKNTYRESELYMKGGYRTPNSCILCIGVRTSCPLVNLPTFLTYIICGIWTKSSDTSDILFNQMHLHNTVWSIGLLEKLIVDHLVNIFHAFYGNIRFITVLPTELDNAKRDNIFCY
jgi:hypothetical protein